LTVEKRHVKQPRRNSLGMPSHVERKISEWKSEKVGVGFCENLRRNCAHDHEKKFLSIGTMLYG